MRLRAVILDWDGTILDSGNHHSFPRLERVLQSFGRTVDDEARQRGHKAAGMPGHLFVKHVLGIEEEEALQIHHAWEAFDEQDPQPFVAGAIETIERLRACGLALGIVSARERKSLMLYANREAVFSTFSITCGTTFRIKNRIRACSTKCSPRSARHGLKKTNAYSLATPSSISKPAQRPGYER
jgi:beta-phosphoglucomutase-like phosphatase (HAD superfamily)